MEEIEFIEVVDLITNQTEIHIKRALPEGGWETMPKSKWDELEAQKELGGTL